MPRPKVVPTLKIQRLPPNLIGRDLVCGDIHGSYSCVTAALKGLNFDKTKDRFICAGDLVDRGPSNEACLDLIYQPWFYACMGNHEQLMFEFFKGGYYGQWWQQNGGGWGTKYKTEQTTMAQYVRKAVKKIEEELPYLITVEKKDGGLFHVLHAELPPRAPFDSTHREDSQDEVITDAIMAD